MLIFNKIMENLNSSNNLNQIEGENKRINKPKPTPLLNPRRGSLPADYDRPSLPKTPRLRTPRSASALNTVSEEQASNFFNNLLNSKKSDKEKQSVETMEQGLAEYEENKNG